jgi:hypothetical protein
MLQKLVNYKPLFPYNLTAISSKLLPLVCSAQKAIKYPVYKLNNPPKHIKIVPYIIPFL